MGELLTLIRAQPITLEFVAKAKHAAMEPRPYRERDAALASATYARDVARGGARGRLRWVLFRPVAGRRRAQPRGGALGAAQIG